MTTYCSNCSRPHVECPACHNQQYCDYCVKCELHPRPPRATRAPWKFITSTAGDRGKVITDGHHEEGIDDTVCLLPYDNCESNGHLLAAAPEMLVVLRRAGERLRFLNDDFLETEISTVIAKTEGRS
jgi:hypothetical protein